MIEPSSINVRDLAIVRPNRTGPGGDEVGTGTMIGSGLDACVVQEDKYFRRANGREAVSFAQVFVSPWYDEAGELAAIQVGDLASWTDLLGQAIDPQEIISVEPIPDCSGLLDVIAFRVGSVVATGFL